MAADSNIVGYKTVTLDKEWTILGLNFEDCGGGSLPLQEVMKYAAGMTTGANDNAADCIQVQNTLGAYDIYYLSNGTISKGVTDSELDGKWVNTKDTPIQATSDSLSTGTAFWYLARNPDANFKVTMPGQVLIAATTNMPVTLAVKQIANPYPTDLPLNDGLAYTMGMTKGANDNAADCIQVQNTLGAYDIYYLSNGTISKGVTDPELDGKWVNTKDTPIQATSDSIPLGKGAWYLRYGNSNFAIEIVRPFSL